MTVSNMSWLKKPFDLFQNLTFLYISRQQVKFEKIYFVSSIAMKLPERSFIKNHVQGFLSVSPLIIISNLHTVSLGKCALHNSF